MRANIGFRSGDMAGPNPSGRLPNIPTAFQSAVLEYMEIHGDGYGAVVGGNYYSETQVRVDCALAEQLYWSITQ